MVMTLAPECLCPDCGKKIDALTGTAIPKEGDISVCLGCGGFLSILCDLTVRSMTKEDLRLLDLDDPSCYALLMTMRQKVLTKHGRSN